MLATLKSGLQVMETTEPACAISQFKACPVCVYAAGDTLELRACMCV